MPATTVPVADQAAALLAASRKYNVPITDMVGIYGVETDFGRNIATSSAGAVGPFQFMPANGPTYNYPLTNTPTSAQFAQQADAFGKYLKARNTGGPEGYANAMGGGYHKAQTDAALARAPKALMDALATGAVTAQGNTPGVTGNFKPLKPFTDLAGAVGAIASLLTTTDTWLRLGAAIAGMVLIYVGIRVMTGSSVGHALTGPARTAAKVKPV